MTIVKQLALSALLLVGCATAPPVSSTSLLAPRIDQYVELTGRFGGPGKIADFVVVDGEPVYLPHLPQEPPPPPYGTAVMVKGVLRYYTPPPEPCDNKAKCRYAIVPAHYFIDGAALEIAP
jgi:hypothetical protein